LYCKGNTLLLNMITYTQHLKL